MADRLPRRPILLLALLLGALVAAWRPLVAQPVPTSEDSALVDVALSVMGSGHGSWCLPNLSEGAPTHRRSPSWHRGTGRRSSRSAGFTPIAAPAGSIPAFDPFIRQHAASFVESTMRSQGTGRSAVSPRAPPAAH